MATLSNLVHLVPLLFYLSHKWDETRFYVIPHKIVLKNSVDTIRLKMMTYDSIRYCWSGEGINLVNMLLLHINNRQRCQRCYFTDKSR